MSDTITLTGFVVGDPRVITTGEGLAITSFRLASNQRRFDRSQSKWIDGETNWYTITTFRQLAANAALSVKKGHRVVVVGKLHVRNWNSNGKSGTNIEVDAEALGHDLTWGTASFSRSTPSTSADSIRSGPDFPTAAELDAVDSSIDETTGVISEPVETADPTGELVDAGASLETPF